MYNIIHFNNNNNIKTNKNSFNIHNSKNIVNINKNIKKNYYLFIINIQTYN